ncbi:MAG: hypothetical protein LBQ68_06420 [Clostridiales bacterium]|jgi:hypothetical protein|nr:hypothetical protein [Clostridiales bacterium]
MKLINDESGATSVLILFMMITLVTLGAYSITSAHVNYIFCQKAVEWNQNYYECDKAGERFLADIDSALNEAERRTALNLLGSNNINYDQSSQEELSTLYLEYVNEELGKLYQKYHEMNYKNNKITTDVSIGRFHISIEVEILPLRYLFASSGDASSSDETKRYSVTRWEQWQDLQLESTEQLWDGNITIEEIE